MILSGHKIKECCLDTGIVIQNFKEENLNPNSYDLTLSNKLVYYLNNTVDLRKDNETVTMIIPEQGLTIYPGRFYLGSTIETAGSEKYIPMIEGKSSLARAGIAVHVTAGFGDVGFIGKWTLEISCKLPVKIYPGMRICQIYFHTILGEYDLYAGKYNHAVKAEATKSFKGEL